MKKVFSILLVLLAFSIVVSAKPPKRITFPKGATKVTVSGFLNGYKDSQTYLIRLRKGQKMTVDADKPVSIAISDPKGENASDWDASCHSHQIVEMSKAGDYKIEAMECQKADPWKGTYNLTIKVEEYRPPVPEKEELNELVQTSLQDFTNAAEAGDFTNFRNNVSTVFKKQFTVKQFNDTFAPFITQRTNIVPILRSTKGMNPVYAPSPKTSVQYDYEVLEISGNYDTEPLPTKFSFRYIREDDLWKLIRLEISIAN
ncbi:MAG: hypothetical protein K1X72_15180 [Pyrinomonadaceae bacterium]|nr:hypothetical protein [Pyrinomonadaceae bacterium]